MVLGGLSWNGRDVYESGESEKYGVSSDDSDDRHDNDDGGKSERFKRRP